MTDWKSLWQVTGTVVEEHSPLFLSDALHNLLLAECKPFYQAGLDARHLGTGNATELLLCYEGPWCSPKS
jgi:hypothetical protein